MFQSGGGDISVGGGGLGLSGGGVSGDVTLNLNTDSTHLHRCNCGDGWVNWFNIIKLIYFIKWY